MRVRVLSRRLVLAGALLAACGPGGGEPNLLLVTLDTTRADRFGFSVHGAARTPSFDIFSRERAVTFLDAVTAAPLTLPSHATILSGTTPNFHGVHDNDGYALDEGVTTLAEILRARGYSTAAFVASFPLDAQFNLDQGFDVYDDDYRRDLTPAESTRTVLSFTFVERPADHVNRAVFRWLESAPRQPFFLWVHYFDPHNPYQPPVPYDSQLAHSPYDGEIAFMDEQFGRLLAALEGRELLHGTTIVVAGDHGESLFEHGEPSHAAYIYDVTMRVPLLVAAADGRGAGRRVEAQVRTLDLAPTALDLLGLPPGEEMQGRSLVPLMDDPGISWSEDALLESFFGRLHFGWGPLRALRSEGWKYIEAPKPELYDLRSDPGEQINLADRHPQRAAALRQQLARLARGYASDDRGRSTSAGADVDALRKLETLGYLGGGSRAVRSEAFPAPAQLAEMANPLDLAPVLLSRNVVREHLRSGNFSDAAAAARRGRARDPQNPGLRLDLGVALTGLGNLDGALVELRLAAERMPDSSRPHLALGRLHQLRGEPRAAVDELTVAHRLEPAAAGTLAELAAAHLQLGEDSVAIELLEELVTVGGAGLGAHLELAAAYARTGRFEQAAAAADRELDRDPYSSAVHYRCGVYHHRAGNLSRARQLLERTLELTPNHGGARLQLVELLLDAGGEEALARRHLEIVQRSASEEAAAGRARALAARLGSS